MPSARGSTNLGSHGYRMNKIDEYRAFMRNADGKLDLGVYNLTVNARAIKDGPIEPTLFSIHNLTEADYANYKPMCLNIISSETVRLPLPPCRCQRALPACACRCRPPRLLPKHARAMLSRLRLPHVPARRASLAGRRTASRSSRRR